MNTKKAVATLTGFEGTKTTQSGDMVLVVSVDLDDNDYEGRISSNDRITEDDYITLMNVVCQQCFENLENPMAKNAAAFVLRAIIEKNSNGGKA